MIRSTHVLAVKSQEWFVEAMLSLMQQKPFQEITISELCRKAKLDRRTFYRNFKDKQDILSYYFSSLQEEYTITLTRVSEQTFYTLAKVNFTFWQEHLDFLKTAKNDEALYVLLIQMLNRFIPEMYVHSAGMNTEKARIGIAFLIGGFHNVLLHWLFSGCQQTADEMAAILAGMVKDSAAYWPKL